MNLHAFAAFIRDRMGELATLKVKNTGYMAKTQNIDYAIDENLKWLNAVMKQLNKSRGLVIKDTSTPDTPYC